MSKTRHLIQPAEEFRFLLGDIGKKLRVRPRPFEFAVFLVSIVDFAQYMPY